MSAQYPDINQELADWLGAQHMFFVASAPLSGDGHVNCSPRGGDCFRILGPSEVVFQDYTGSGAETAAHIRENGRIVIMFCSFEGAPKIVRLHGRGTVVTSDQARFSELSALFPPHLGTRAFVVVAVNRVSDSCGYGVPLYDFRADRDTLDKWCEAKGQEKLEAYRAAKNQKSIDGLTAFG